MLRAFLLISAVLVCIKLLLIVPILPEGVSVQNSNLTGVRAYRSTDFDVHRHWKAVTRNLPLHQWYKESGNSIWTLDYPPFFAYFEMLLSNFVHPMLQDKGISTFSASPEEMKRVKALFGQQTPQLREVLFQTSRDAIPAFPVHFRGRHLFSVKNPWQAIRRYVSDNFYDGNLTALGSPPEAVTASMVRFMRSTVFIGDFLLLVAVVLCTANNPNGDGTASREGAWIGLLLLAHPALVLIDNVHFQYNSLVFAIFCASVASLQNGSPLLCAWFYFALVMFKHLFICYAPAFGLWGLCCIVATWNRCGIRSALKLTFRFVMMLVITLLVAFGPFVASEPTAFAQAASGGGRRKTGVVPAFEHNAILRAVKEAIPPIVERLFPFGRGLCHAYWAPNAFPLYNVLDRTLCKSLVAYSRGSHAGNVVRQLLSGLRVLLGQQPIPIPFSNAEAARLCDGTSVNTKGLVYLSAAVVPSAASEAAASKALAPSHAVLPYITPLTCIALILASFFGMLYILARDDHSSYAPTQQQRESGSPVNSAKPNSISTSSSSSGQRKSSIDFATLPRRIFDWAVHVGSVPLSECALPDVTSGKDDGDSGSDEDNNNQQQLDKKKENEKVDKVLAGRTAQRAERAAERENLIRQRLDLEEQAQISAQWLLKMCTISAMSFFLFGWHVHEKAILNITVPLLLFVASLMRPDPHAVRERLAVQRVVLLEGTVRDLSNFIVLSTLTVLPLFFTAKECVLKYLFMMAHGACSVVVLRRHVQSRVPTPVSILHATFTISNAVRFLLLIMAFASIVVDIKANTVFWPLMAYSCLGSVAFVLSAVGVLRILKN